MATQNVRLSKNTLRLVRKRKEWRKRATSACIDLVTWPTAKPGRDEVEAEVIKSLNKIRQWFRHPRCESVIQSIQRKAVHVYRNQ